MNLILHHYPASPFSEKVRAALGFKGATWQSVHIPMMMPKPKLLPLTGGYRRTPVLQIGADIYCDTRLILDEIERRLPTPSFHPGGPGGRGLDHALSFWADRTVFQTAVAVVFATVGRFMPADFIEDRRKLSGTDFDFDQMEAASPAMQAQFMGHLAAAEAMLEGHDFLRGPAPVAADFALYQIVWFVGGAYPAKEALFAPFPRVTAWAARIAGLGHGTEQLLDEDAALAIARDTAPATDLPVQADDPSGLSRGALAIVLADDYGRDPVAGRVVGLTTERISLLREDADVGAIVVHFPRTGYLLLPAPGA